MVVIKTLVTLHQATCGAIGRYSIRKISTMSTNKRGFQGGSAFMNKITADGSSGFPAEANRYHLYVSLGCPFASRAVIARKLKGLESVVSMTVVNPVKEDYWSFTDQVECCTLDTVNNCNKLSEVYQKVDPNYDGSVTVPVLWDKVKNTIVSNDSAEILHMLVTEMNALCATEEQRKWDLSPADKQDKIQELHDWINPNLTLGVYKTCSAPNQESYDAAVKGVFDTLDKLDDLLSKTRYLLGSEFSEADVKLFTSLVRFDWVYYPLFKCDKKRIMDYPNLWGYLRDIYQIAGVSDTVNRHHIRVGYYTTPYFNASKIVSIGPDLDFNSPHGRGQMG